ncbi:uncharacterized protein LOC135498798 isoform X1 [Lineus longissimus]|uniref:uncharacterized protein LOC135498798 isoform X1 n=1 Tax=Lineus longissimus TaxID=88925 RepID=UPI002B4FA0D9
MKLDTVFVLIALVLVCTVLSTCHGSPTAECLKLEQMARQASQRQIPGFKMYCQKNKACTGIDCNGNINMPTYKIQTEFCFGFEIQNCMKPTKVDFYTYLPSLNKSFEERLGNSERRKIPGASIDIGIGTIDPFANITLIDKPNNKILFGVGLALRVTYLFDRQGHWPRNLQYTLIPPTEIPVAPCKTPSTTMAPPLDNKCITRGPQTTTWPGIKTTSRPSRPPLSPEPFSSPLPAKPTVRPSKGTKPTSRPSVAPIPVTTPKHTGPRPQPSPTFGKKCDPYNLQSCGANEKCPVDSKDPRCQCASLKTYDKWSGHCVGASPVPHPTKHSVLPTKAAMKKSITVTDDSSNHKTIVIAACSTAGFLLVAAIAITTIIIIRKKRARYADHDILLQNDDSEVNI